MRGFDFSQRPDDDRVLLISFHNNTPLSASQVADVLRALDKDYQRITGSELVLVQMQLGSTWIWLTDIVLNSLGFVKGAADSAKALENLWSFSKRLRDGFKPKQLPPVNEPLTSVVEAEFSISALAKVAEKKNCLITIKKSSVTALGVESLEISVTPAEARAARIRTQNKKKSRKSTKIAVPYSAIEDTLAERVQLRKTLLALPPTSFDADTIIRMLAQAIIASGNIHILEELAITLDAEGRSDLATIIRHYLGRGRGELTIKT